MVKPKQAPLAKLGRRERQIMEILFELERATASEVHARLADRPSYSTVRAMLRLLEEKGHARHVAEGNHYVYSPTMSQTDARHSALIDVVKTFFRGSREAAMVALLKGSKREISDEELRRLATIIRNARSED